VKLSSAVMRVPTTSQQFADRAHLEGQDAGGVMMAGNQPPQFSSHHERYDEGRVHAQVLEILSMDGRHAAQGAQGHVEILAGERRQIRDQGLGLVVDVRQQAHAVLFMEAARVLRDVGGGIAMAQKSFEIGFLCPRKNMAMTRLVEAMDHGAVIARQLLEDVRGLVAQALERRRVEEGLDRRFNLRRGILRRPRALDFDHQPAAARMVQQGGEGLARIAKMTAQRDRDRVYARPEPGPHESPQVAAQRLEGGSQQIALQAKKSASLLAALNNKAVRLTQEQESAVRLD